MSKFCITRSNRLLKFEDSMVDSLELVDGKWIKPKSLFGWEVDPREDDVEFFDSETEALNILKSRSSNS